MAEAFCANCIEGVEGLKPTMVAGKKVLICWNCRNEHPRGGRYHFDESYTGRRPIGHLAPRSGAYESNKRGGSG